MGPVAVGVFNAPPLTVPAQQFYRPTLPPINHFYSVPTRVQTQFQPFGEQTTQYVRQPQHQVSGSASGSHKDTGTSQGV